MKESYDEELAIHIGPDPYADGGNVVGVASVRGTGRPAIELRNPHFCAPTLWCQGEGNMLDRVMASGPQHGGVVEPVHARKLQTREPGDPISFRFDSWRIATKRNDQKTSQAVMLI
jgi:hypothetical protein